ncbi:MAG: hypothetical protein PQJ58_16880 [Spirochaetales bacterium]|nr:hypothetical protein [Spirochaetales bacterium]
MSEQKRSTILTFVLIVITLVFTITTFSCKNPTGGDDLLKDPPGDTLAAVISGGASSVQVLAAVASPFTASNDEMDPAETTYKWSLSVKNGDEVQTGTSAAFTPEIMDKVESYVLSVILSDGQQQAVGSVDFNVTAISAGITNKLSVEPVNRTQVGIFSETHTDDLSANLLILETVDGALTPADLADFIVTDNFTDGSEGIEVTIESNGIFYFGNGRPAKGIFADAVSDMTIRFDAKASSAVTMPILIGDGETDSNDDGTPDPIFPSVDITTDWDSYAVSAGDFTQLVEIGFINSESSNLTVYLDNIYVDYNGPAVELTGGDSVIYDGSQASEYTANDSNFTNAVSFTWSMKDSSGGDVDLTGTTTNAQTFTPPVLPVDDYTINCVATDGDETLTVGTNLTVKYFGVSLFGTTDPAAPGGQNVYDPSINSGEMTLNGFSGSPAGVVYAVEKLPFTSSDTIEVVLNVPAGTFATDDANSINLFLSASPFGVDETFSCTSLYPSPGYSLEVFINYYGAAINYYVDGAINLDSSDTNQSSVFLNAGGAGYTNTNLENDDLTLTFKNNGTIWLCEFKASDGTVIGEASAWFTNPSVENKGSLNKTSANWFSDGAYLHIRGNKNITIKSINGSGFEEITP